MPSAQFSLRENTPLDSPKTHNIATGNAEVPICYSIGTGGCVTVKACTTDDERAGTSALLRTLNLSRW